MSDMSQTQPDAIQEKAMYEARKAFGDETAIKKTPLIEKGIEDLIGSVAEMRQVLSRLRERLNPVMRPSSDDTSTPQEPQGPCSQIAFAIQTINEDVIICRGMVFDILERLEI